MAPTVGMILFWWGCVWKPFYLEDKMDKRKLAGIYRGITNTRLVFFVVLDNLESSCSELM